MTTCWKQDLIHLTMSLEFGTCSALDEGAIQRRKVQQQTTEKVMMMSKDDWKALVNVNTGQTEQSIGGLDSTALVFPKDLIKAFFSSSSDLSAGQSLQAPSRTGLDLSSSSSQTIVANLDCKEA